MRVATKNRKLFEPNLTISLRKRNIQLKDFFEIKEFNLLKKSNNVTKAVAYCKNVDKFIEYLLEKRNLSEAHLKFGVDSGHGFLKVCLSLQANVYQNIEINQKRSKYSEGVCPNDFKDTSLKKLFVLAISKIFYLK